MKLDAGTRSEVYSVISETWRERQRSRFKWARGEKGKGKALFTSFAEMAGERDPERFEYVLGFFEEYLAWGTQRWSTWEPASRSNWLGFLSSPKVMEDFFIKHKTRLADTKQIAGTKGFDEWAL